MATSLLRAAAFGRGFCGEERRPVSTSRSRASPAARRISARRRSNQALRFGGMRSRNTSNAASVRRVATRSRCTRSESPGSCTAAASSVQTASRRPRSVRAATRPTGVDAASRTSHVRFWFLPFILTITRVTHRLARDTGFGARLYALTVARSTRTLHEPERRPQPAPTACPGGVTPQALRRPLRSAGPRETPLWLRQAAESFWRGGSPGPSAAHRGPRAAPAPRPSGTC